MKVTEIVVSAGRTFNHPYESYSNLKPQVTIKATIENGEDFETEVNVLQAKAERLVEDHKAALLTNLEEIHNLTERQREIASLEDGLKRTQARLDALRAGVVQTKSLPEFGVIEDDDKPW